MHRPKGFGKNYFSLSAICAYSSAVTLHSQCTAITQSSRNFSLETLDEEDEPLEELELLQESTFATQVSACHCNYHFKILLYRLTQFFKFFPQTFFIYIKNRSGLAPPLISISSQTIKYNSGKQMTRTITLSFLSSLLLSNLHAVTIKLDEVSVEAANRTSQNIKDVTESTTLITSQELEESHVQTLGEALSKFGNIAFTNSGGAGKSTSMFLRGMDTKRTLVLIDGVRFNNPTSSINPIQYQHILVNDIERIEIIKGAQSGVWGADASAGVINVITKSAKKGTHVSVNLQTGSFNTQQGSVQLSHMTDSFDLTAGISRIKTEGFSAAGPKQTNSNYGIRAEDLGWEDDGYTNNTYNLKLGLNITDQDRVEASYKRIDASLEYDNTGADATKLEKTDNRFYSLAYKHKDKVNDLFLQYNNAYFNNIVSNFKGNTQEISIQDRINYREDSFVRLGASYQKFEHEKAQSSTTDKDYSNRAIYLSNYNKSAELLSFGNTIFTQSLRHDNYSVFEDKTTGKLGLKQFIYDNDIYISTNYGTAYNVPLLTQLYGTYGNTALKPEETETIDFTLGNDKLTLTYFENQVTDMIEWSAGGYYNSLGKSNIKGVEIAYKDDFFDVLTVNLNGTYLDAKNADGQLLSRRPKRQLDGNIFYYISDDLNIGLNAQYIGARYNSSSNQNTQTGKYTLFNAVVNYEVNNNFSLYAKVDNLTDKYYQIVDGYSTAKRSFYAGLNAKF